MDESIEQPEAAGWNGIRNDELNLSGEEGTGNRDGEVAKCFRYPVTFHSTHFVSTEYTWGEGEEVSGQKLL